MQVNVSEARKRLSRLIKSARAGEDVLITNRGEPMARLVPVGRAPPTAAGTGSARCILDWLDRHPLSAEEIDATIEDERE